LSGICKQKCLLALLLYPEWRSIPLCPIDRRQSSCCNYHLRRRRRGSSPLRVLPVPCEERSRLGKRGLCLLLANIAMKLEKQEADVQCIGCERCETHRLVLVCFGCKRDDGTSISTTGCPESVARRKRGRWRMAEANACEPSYLPGVRRERRRGRDGIEGNVGDDTETRGKWRLLGVSLLRPGRIEPSSSFHVVPRAPRPLGRRFSSQRNASKGVRFPAHKPFRPAIDNYQPTCYPPTQHTTVVTTSTSTTYRPLTSVSGASERGRCCFTISYPFARSTRPAIPVS